MVSACKGILLQEILPNKLAEHATLVTVLAAGAQTLGCQRGQPHYPVLGPGGTWEGNPEGLRPEWKKVSVHPALTSSCAKAS